MSDIYTIAKSGLKAYREGLATTGQNIANVGNEAYSRREASISEVKSGSTDVLQLSENISFGVKVDGISRAFDQFIDLQLHNAKANFSYSEAQTYVFNQLENIVRPDVGGVSQRINEFFASLSTVALDPSSIASRKEAINSAKSVTHSLKSVAVGINDLRSFVEQNIEAGVLDANSYLKQLLHIQKELLSNKNPNNVRNDLLDQRDKILGKLSEVIEIKTHYKSNGELEVFAGAEGQSQVILSGFEMKEFSVGQVEGSSKIFISDLGAANAVKVQVSSGKIAGLISADYGLGQTKNALDELSKKFVSEINYVQKSGVDLNGVVGEEFFSLDAVEIKKLSRSGSTVQLEVQGFSDDFLNKTISAEFVAENDFWKLMDSAGNEIGRFKGSFEQNGVTFNLIGEAHIGDRFDITFTDQRTENISLSLNDERLLAASAYYLPTVHPENSSNVTLATELIGEIETTEVAELNQVLLGSNNSANPITFRDNGVLGLLKDVDNLENLIGLKQQTKLQFSHPFSDLDDNSQLSITLGSTVHTFTIGTFAEESADYHDLASYFNKGVIKTDGYVDGEQLSFADLGLRAGGNANTFLISSAYLGDSDNYAELKTGSLKDTLGLLLPGTTEDTGLQVFTKEGVHLAGTPLSASEVNQLISDENGFSRDARYTASYLATGDLSKYIDAEVSRITSTGNHVANITSLAMSNKANSNLDIDVMANMPLERSKMSAPLIVQSPQGETITFDASQGMMAGQIAHALNEEISDFGIKAKAFNYVEFYDVPSEIVQFELKGNNAVSQDISVDLTSGNIQLLVDTINSYSKSTGISAYKSGMSSMVLTHEDGNDITITNVSVSNSNNVKIRQLDQYGEVIGSPQNDALPSISSGDYVIVGGQIELSSPADFKIINDGVEVLSDFEEFSNGFVDREYLPDAAKTNYKFQTLNVVDSALIGAEGFNVLAASSSYKFEIAGDNQNSIMAAKVLGATGEALTSTNVASSIARELRQQSVQAGFVGNAFNFSDGFPVNGDSLNWRLGDQIYKATLNSVPSYSVEGDYVHIDGSKYSKSDALEYLVTRSKFNISGAEPNRINVGFRNSSDGGFELYAFANDGVISGHSLRLSADNPAEVLSSFHIDNSSSASLIADDFDTSQSLNLVIGQLVVGDTITDITFDNGVVSPADINGISVVLEATGTDTGRIVVSIPNSVADQDIRLKATENSANFGINTASTQLTLTDSGFSLSEFGNNRIEVNAEIKSLANEKITIEGLSGEDLIIVATGNTRPSILGSASTYNQILNPREITAKVVSNDGKEIELLDANSGDLLGVRNLSSTNSFIFKGLEWQFDGVAKKNDQFTLKTSGARADDASNILRFNLLASASDKTGRGGYSEIYSDIVSDTGFKSREAEQRLETTQAIHEVALDRKSEFSGVDLDTEAARLLEQQQAYQALAKVLSTAKELVDTLLRSF